MPREGQPWAADAACRDIEPRRAMELFFPVSSATSRETKVICAGCPVRPQCADYGLRYPALHGVWGGLSEKERSRIRREQRAS